MGDCVDCTLCVQVCPTGIDIRDGLQYMCIGCGACVDVCDQVMDKMGYDKGLIRYTSGNAIKERLTQPEARRRVLRPRVIAYSLILLAVAVALAASMLTRSTLRMDIIRDRGVLGREVPGGLIENIYRLQIMNTAELPLTLHLNADGVEGVTISTVDTERTTVDIAPASNQLVPNVVRVPAGNLEPGLHDISITAEGKSPDGQVRSVNEATRFYVPN